MPPGISVLCVDDDPDVRELTATVLERTADRFEVTTAPTAAEGLSRVKADGVDCVVSDYDMPEVDGLEFLEAVRERDPELPFILFTGKGSEELASEAISAGVTDYFQKRRGTDQYVVLANRIENAVERRRAEQARRESERELERYRNLVETAGDPMYVLDTEGRCRIANEALFEFLGCEGEELDGQRLEEFADSETYERGAAALRRLRETGRERTRIEFTVEGEDGETRVGEVHMAVLTDEDGEFAGSANVVRDISDRKRRERELARYERIIELAPIALFTLDETGTITWMNDEFADAFEEDQRELLGTRFPELVERGYYDERVLRKYEDEVRDLLSSKTSTERAKYHVRFYRPDGDVEIHDVHTELLPLVDGEFAGTIHAIRDITRRRRYQRELERQNERLEKFASLVSHDLRNPLNVAQGNLEEHDCSCEGDEETLETIRWSLARMNELIDELLSLARNGRTVGETDTVSIREHVRAAWDAVDTGDATLELEADGGIDADGGRLRELFENLFRNAVEHGGRDVTITVGMLDDGGTPVGWFVEDDGEGLPDDADEIFEFGHTTSDTGTGLGLAIVHEIADAHGWSVTASEARGGGARFEFRDVAVQPDGPTEANADAESFAE